MDPVALVIQAVFYVLFGVAVWRWVHLRGPVELGVVGVFSATAALFLLSFVSAFAPDLTAAIRPVSLAVLAAQPYLVVRLLDQIWKVPAWASRLALAGFIGTTAALLGLGSRSLVAILTLVVYFGLTETLAAIRFTRLAGRRRGVHRMRLTLAGVATALFGLAIVVAGIGSAASNGAASSPAIQVAGRLLALLAALGYLGAFLPPGWLTAFFHRAAAFDLARQVVSIRPGEGPAILWGQLAFAAESILGAASVRIDDANDRPVELRRTDPAGQSAGGPSDTDPAGRPASAPPIDSQTGSEIVVPLLADGHKVATLTAKLVGRPLFVEDDIAIVGLLGSLTARAVQHDEDMSRLRATELALEESAALRASEARFRVFLEADPNAILATDETGRVTWATRSSADLFAYPDSQLLGRDLADLLELPAQDAGPARIAPGEIRRLETTAARGDGSTLPVEVALRQLEVDGRPTTVAIVSDATWREEANQIRDRFVGILSHELRTPITSIYGGAQLLLKREADLDATTRTDLIVGLADESDRLQRMIENLLILDRVERGADFFGPRPVLVQRVLAAVIEHERALWPAIEVRLDVAGDLPVVTGDEDQLAQILRNLISNAGKYAGDRATIEVRARFESGWVRVTVTDDGPGFPAEEADQLFSLYYRSARSRAAPGAGIGLYVCRNLVEAMGGAIWARVVPTGGAEFGFTLPPYVDADDLPAIEAAIEEADEDRDAAGPADAWAAAAL